MLTYHADGKILRITVTGDLSLREVEAMCQAVRDDPAVQDSSLVLVDAKNTDVTSKDATPSVRIQALVDGLGPKFAKVCAVVEPPHDPFYGIGLQSAGQRLGVHVGLFTTEETALKWLEPMLDRAT